MLVVLAMSIAVLLVATAGSWVVLRRSGDPRVLLLGSASALGAAAAGAALWSLGSRALGFDAASLAACLVLAASLLCPFAVLAVARTLRERDRSESLHWNSMEAVRALAELAGHPSPDLDERLARLLQLGCEHFGLEIGWLTRVVDGRCELRALRAPGDFPLERGARLALEATWCRKALDSPRPVDLSELSTSVFADDAARRSFPVECYLGTAVRCGGEPWGTLAFASRRGSRFGATEKDLLTLMARWIGSELEHRQARPVATAPERAAVPPAPRAAAAPDPPPTRPEARPVPPRPLSAPASRWSVRRLAERAAARRGRRPMDLNVRLRRLERRLQRAAGRRARLELSLAPGALPARDLRVPLEGVLVSLVGHAAEAARGEARIQVASADVDLGAAQPGVMPAVAPDRYVTVSVRMAADEIDSDALSCAFDAPAAEVSLTGMTGRMPLPAVYRVLQRGGGDLSLSVEEGRSLALTVFLPRAPERARSPRPLASAAAPGAAG